MKRMRYIVVAALAAASIGIAAVPASASGGGCAPEEGPCCPHDNPVDRLWVKLTGEHFFNCPWA